MTTDHWQHGALGVVLLMGAMLVGVAPEASARSADDIVREAQHLLEVREAERAYQLLEPLSEQRVMDPHFNYLLGLAALDSGRPGIATFALERVLALRPEHVNARAELARAQTALGEFGAARRALEGVLAANPPARVRATIDAYLARLDEEIRSRAEIGVLKVSGYGIASAGYDSNINTGTDQATIIIPAFLGGTVPFRLSPLFRETGSSLAGTEVGLNLRQRLDAATVAFGSASVQGRYHFKESEFYQYTITGLAGLERVRDKNLYRWTLDTRQHVISSIHVENFLGLTGQWTRALTETDQTTAFGRVSKMNHPATARLNALLFLGGASWVHRFAGPRRPATVLTAYAATEDETRDDPTVGRRFFGVRAGAEYGLGASTTLAASLALERSVYGGQDPFFLRTRRDERAHAALTLVHKLSRTWTVQPEVSYTRNESTISLHDFDRFRALVSVRRDFF